MLASSSTNASNVTNCYARARVIAVCFVRSVPLSVRPFNRTRGAVVRKVCAR
jgi:hypothetical protein